MISTQTGKINLFWFFILLFVVSWAGAVPMIFASYKVQTIKALGMLQVLMLFGPGVVATFVAWRNEEKRG